jgi:PIN domain nuclease of toxin-antitoxin system
MRLLLDTVTFLWVISDAPDLSGRVRELVVDPENDVYLSAVSAWEIAVKHALGRLPLPDLPERFVPEQRRHQGIEELPLDGESALHLNRLAMLHKDPFDRMVVCQAITQRLLLLTPDDLISQYPVRAAW